MRVDHSPYAGRTAIGWPALVLSRGRVVAREGEYVGEPAAGRYLHRGAPLLER
jgi:dihydropyrimidinase